MRGMLDFANGGSFLSSCEALELRRDRKKIAKSIVARMKTPLLLFKARISGTCGILIVEKDPTTRRIEKRGQNALLRQYC